MVLLKLGLYSQTSATTVTGESFTFAAQVEYAGNNSGLNVSLVSPNRTLSLSRDGFGGFSFFETFTTATAMNRDFPAGNYTVRFTGPLTRSYQVPLPSLSLPPAPRIINFDQLQHIESADYFSVLWQPFATGTIDDVITLTILADDGSYEYDSDVAHPDGVTGITTGLDLSLPVGKTFTGLLQFYRFGDGTFFDNGASVGLPVFVSATEFHLSTIPLTSAPVFTLHPTDQTEVMQSAVTFEAMASGKPNPTYKWQRLSPDDASGWQDLNDGGGISGSGSPSLTITNLSLDMSGDRFRCVASNSAGNSTSAAATLSVRPGYAFSTLVGGFPGGDTDGPTGIGRLNYPTGVAVDSMGNVYVSSKEKVRRITPHGYISTFAGTSPGGTSIDGTAAAAQFGDISGIAIDAHDNVYVTDSMNQNVRRISKDGIVVTLAGVVGEAGSNDGPGSVARFFGPGGIVVDANGVVYVADTWNETVRRIEPDGTTTTVAGSAGASGFADGPGPSARFHYPRGLALDVSGNLYVADSGNNLVRRISPDGVVTTVAGQPGISGTLDGLGSHALFSKPAGITIDAAGNLFVVDELGFVVRRIAQDGMVTTIAGHPGVPGSVDGTAGQAYFYYPAAVVIDRSAHLYVVDRESHSLRKGTAWSSASFTGQPSDIAGSAGSSLSLTGSASVASGTDLRYQWQRNGKDIPGATGTTYTIPNVQPFHAGSYTLVAYADGIPFASDQAIVTVDAPPPSNARLMSLSTRAWASFADNVLIPGFVIQGTGTRRLMIRGVGPKLGVPPFNLPGVLPDPRMTLMKFEQGTGGYVEVAHNDNWGDNSNLADILVTSSQVFAFDLDEGSLDAVLLADLEPGQYTVVIDDTNAGSGVAIVELYDADPTNQNSRMTSISTRGFVGTGSNVMIPGFVVSNDGPKTFLIRAVGPTLESLGVGNALRDPLLEIVNRQGNGTEVLLFAQDNWSDEPGSEFIQEISNQLGAFPLQPGSLDASIVVTLPPGVYTVICSGKDGTSGIGLVEVYQID